jgi:hypothetical protein
MITMNRVFAEMWAVFHSTARFPRNLVRRRLLRRKTFPIRLANVLVDRLYARLARISRYACDYGQKTISRKASGR